MLSIRFSSFGCALLQELSILVNALGVNLYEWYDLGNNTDYISAELMSCFTFVFSQLD